MDRRSFLRWGALLGSVAGAGLGSACVSSTPLAATAAATAASPTQAPGTPPIAGQASANWDQVKAAAQQEGALTILSFQGTSAQDALVGGFQQAYPGIHLDYTGTEVAGIPAKLSVEQGAGQFTTDLVFIGTTSVIASMIPGNQVTPVLPYLGGPGTNDLSAWYGQKLSFADTAAQYNVVFSAFVKPALAINTAGVSADALTSYRDLLNPSWKGRIALRDPRIPGGGQAQALFWYSTASLGKPFLQEFFQQDITISNQDQQILDWVAHGTYPIGIGASDPLTLSYIQSQLGITGVPGQQMQEGSYLTAGTGTIVVPRNPPHPNALRVYLDWLLSVEGQSAWVKAIGFPSLRQDVPFDPAFSYLVPKDGENYPATYTEEFLKLEPEVTAFVKTLLPS